VSKKQPPSEARAKMVAQPIPIDMALRAGPIVTVKIGAAPPAQPAEKIIHARRRLPDVPDAPPPSAPSKSGDE
jgi:hypothetical protein